jgi:hypothetical protein
MAAHQRARAMTSDCINRPRCPVSHRLEGDQAMKAQAIRRVRVDRIWAAGNQGRYEIGIGKRDLGTAERIDSRTWRTSSGHMTRTLRAAAELLFNRRLMDRAA